MKADFNEVLDLISEHTGFWESDDCKIIQKQFMDLSVEVKAAIQDRHEMTLAGYPSSKDYTDLDIKYNQKIKEATQVASSMFSKFVEYIQKHDSDYFSQRNCPYF